jgi:hypothetical protein
MYSSPASDGGCLCECPPGTGGRRCERTSCSSPSRCINKGQCVLLDGREVCNCTSEFAGLTCSYKISSGQLNPCDDLVCRNGGICQGSILQNSI